MAINTAVYGTPDTWRQWDYNSNYDVKQLPRFANFTGSTTAIFDDTSMLKVGQSQGKVQINVPIDTSIAVLGVDDDCSLVHQTWHKRGATVDEKFAVSMKRNGVNPLAWAWRYSTYSNFNNMPTMVLYNNSHAWAYYQAANSDNPDTYLAPIASYPAQCVHVIFVQVYRSVDEVKQHGGWFMDLYTYLNGHIENNTSSPKWCEQYKIIHCIYTREMYRNKTEVTDPDTRTDYYRGFGGDFYVPGPIILNEIEDFVDPDTPERQRRILRYTQASRAPTTPTSERFISPYRPDDYIGITLTSGVAPVQLFGCITFGPINVPGSDLTYRLYYMGLVGHANILHTEFYSPNSNSRNFIWYSDVDNDFGGLDKFVEYCHKQAAYLGGFFTDSYDAAQKEPYLDSDHFYLGAIDDNGVTHGEYTRGQDNRKQKQWDWETFEKNNYDPEKKPEAPDKEQESDPYTFTKGNPNGLKGAFYYLCDDDILPNLQLWAHDIVDPPGPFVKPGTTDIPEGSYSPEALAYDIERRFNGSYPFDNILSVQWFPFDLSKALSQGPDFPALNVIVMGNTTTSAIDNWYGGSVPAVNARQAVGSQYVVFDSEAYTIDEYFNDFRDYSPYTSMDLVIPWHGTISLDPGHWYGHQLSTKMVIDVITGASTTYIMRDSITIQSIDGHVGTSVPLSIRNIGDFTSSTIAASQALNDQKYTNARSYLNSAAGIVGGAAMIGGAVATGNIPLAIAGGISAGKQIIGSEIDMIQADKQLQNKEFAVGHAPSGSTQVSAATPAVSQYASRDLRLIIKRPHLLPGYNATTYGASVGFACNRQGPVGNNTGFSVFSGADLDGLTATDTEKSKIYGLLQTGIII